MSLSVVQSLRVEKSFSTVKAVDGISFEIRPGEIFALLGPNGAGKSTLVRMLLGLIRPDVGKILYGLGGPSGQPPRPEQVGYLPEDRGLYKDIPILRTLTYFGTLRGMDRRAAERAGREWLERLGLSELLAAVESEHEVLGVRTGRESLHDIYVRALGGEPAFTSEETSA